MVMMCCEEMKNNAFDIDCNEFPQESLKNKVVYYSSKFNEYGIPIHDGENGRPTSYLLISYCPWCGTTLPQSRRDEWFDLLEKLGFDYPLEEYDKIPSIFKCSLWYENNQGTKQSGDGSMIEPQIP